MSLKEVFKGIVRIIQKYYKGSEVNVWYSKVESFQVTKPPGVKISSPLYEYRVLRVSYGGDRSTRVVRVEDLEDYLTKMKFLDEPLTRFEDFMGFIIPWLSIFREPYLDLPLWKDRPSKRKFFLILSPYLVMVDILPSQERPYIIRTYVHILEFQKATLEGLEFLKRILLRFLCSHSPSEFY